MSAETPDYMPQVGDVVTFAKARIEINRTMRYVITGAGEAAVAFKHEAHDHVYIKSLAELREIGITKAEPVTAKES